MSDFSANDPNSEAGISRRTFLKTASGVVAISILGTPEVGRSNSTLTPNHNAMSGNMGAVAGKAKRRIDGHAKVTGEKVYARDFNARNMHGWPQQQWYALYLRALKTDAEFQELNLSSLPDKATPTKIIYGDQLTAAQRSPSALVSRDQIMDDKIRESFDNIEPVHVVKQPESLKDKVLEQDPVSFNHPSAVVFDLIVLPGNKPDYLGQPVALLLYDSLAGYKAAHRALQFQDGQFQTYADKSAPNRYEGEPFSPETHYVKVEATNSDEADFSYAQTAPDAYNEQADSVGQKVNNVIKKGESTPDQIIQPFKSEMLAMDPMFMEPEAGLAWLDKGDEAGDQKSDMHLVLGTQSPDGDVSSIVSMYNDTGSPTPLKNVILNSCYPGGGFGGRDSSPFSLMIALAAGFCEGNPVKLSYDRFEQFRVGLKRHAAKVDGHLLLNTSQRILAIEGKMQFDGGGRKNLSPYVASLAALCIGGSYSIPKANIHANAIHSQNISGGSQRGFGGPQAFFAIETALDEVAYAKNWDRIELRRRNLIALGDRTITGGPIDQSLQLETMLDKAERHPLWAKREQIKAEKSSQHIQYGTGLAMSLQAYGTSGDGVIAAIKMDRKGRFIVKSDAVDMGNGSATTLGVVIGPILGANAKTVDMGDYTLFDQSGLKTKYQLPKGDAADYSNPIFTEQSVGSSSACLTALHQVHVVQQTAQALLEQSLLPAAALLWKVADLNASQIEWQDGRMTLKGRDYKPLSLETLAHKVHDVNLPTGTLGHAFFQNSWVKSEFISQQGKFVFELDGLAIYKSASAVPAPLGRRVISFPPAGTSRYARYVWAPCVNVIGLTVDKRTGHVRLEDVVSVLNAGRIHVPELVSGQSQGGIAMATGYTLLEEMPPGMQGPANGRWNLNKYHVARYLDMPLDTEYTPEGRSQELILIDPDAAVPGRGIAEAVMCSIAPAISNALKDAVGVRYQSLPITPSKILRGLQS